MTGSEATTRATRGRGLLWTACALLVCAAVVDVYGSACSLVDMARSTWNLASFDDVIMLLGVVFRFFCMSLELTCVLRAVRVTRLQEEDTHDYVAESQLIAIALMGVIIVAWCLTALLEGTFESGSMAVLGADLVPILLYYRAVSRESHSCFWVGVRREEGSPSEGEIPSAMPPANLVLDEKTGYVRAMADAERPCVLVRAWDEFATEHDSESFLRHAERLVKPISLTAAYPYDEAIFGTILVPEEELVTADIRLDGCVALAYYLADGVLTLIAEDDQARRFLSWYLDNQYLRKESLVAVIYEVQDLVMGNNAAYLVDLDARLDQLEASISESVTEVPRDFSGYVSTTRRDLGVAQRFYRQVADAARDIAVDESCLDRHERHLFSGLQNRATELLNDTKDLRDYIFQIRSGYQGHINVRQNNVMSILTIVTTIATPIALITGWYGMNFDNMSELHYQSAYGIVTIVVVAIVTLEVIYFKKKRWF